jgi:hypothetical protein
MLTLLLAAAVASTAPAGTCAKLEKQFVDNEQSFALIHKMARDMAKAWQISASLSLEDSIKARQAQEDAERYDRQYEAEGDRITTLLIANHCKAPDHVTSWATYASSEGSDPQP